MLLWIVLIYLKQNQMKFNIKHIYDFAQAHDIGSDVFINNRTGEIIELPNPIIRPNAELEEFFAEDIEKIESNWHEITKLECPESSEAFDIMASFIDGLNQSETKEQLSIAISKSKPFRNFNNIIHNCDKREDWFEHKRLELEKRVAKMIDREERRPAHNTG